MIRPPLLESRSSSRSRGGEPMRSALKHSDLHVCDGDPPVDPTLLSPPGSPMHRPTLILDVPSFERRVGFDTFETFDSLEGSTTKSTGGGTGVSYSFSISAKSLSYVRSKASRTFLVATDLNEYSRNALDWLISNLVEDSDEIVVLRVIEPGTTAHDLWERSVEDAREEAEKVLEEVMKKIGEDHKISIVVEFAIGGIEETIHRMIEIYRPDSLIVGTRGRSDSVWKSAFMGSISKYAVAKAPIPTIVVRPESKVKASMTRMDANPMKRAYVSLLSVRDPTPEVIPALFPASAKRNNVIKQDVIPEPNRGRTLGRSGTLTE